MEISEIAIFKDIICDLKKFEFYGFVLEVQLQSILRKCLESILTQKFPTTYLIILCAYKLFIGYTFQVLHCLRINSSFSQCSRILVCK